MIEFSAKLAEHTLTRPLGLLLHLLIHRHRANDMCPGCWDDLR